MHRNGITCMRSYEILYDKLFRMNKWCCMIGNFSKSLQTQWIGFDSSVQCLWSTYSAIYCYLKSFLISSIDSIKYCTMLAWSPGSMTKWQKNQLDYYRSQFFGGKYPHSILGLFYLKIAAFFISKGFQVGHLWKCWIKLQLTAIFWIQDNSYQINCSQLGP